MRPTFYLSLFIFLFCLACKSTRPASPLTLVIYFSEGLDTLLLDDNDLTIKTYRNIMPFLEALKSQLGAQSIGYFGGKDTVFQRNFPADGPGNYRWQNRTLFGQKNLEISLDWDEYRPPELSFSIFDEGGLPASNNPDIIKWLDGLAKTHLYTQPVSFDSQGLFLDSGSERQVYIKKELSEMVKVDWAAFQQEIDKRLLDDPLAFNLSIRIDKKGKGTIEHYDGADTLEMFLTNWVHQLQFPLVIFKEMRDTGTYSLDLDIRRSDNMAIASMQAACRNGRLGLVKDDVDENPYFRSSGSPGGLIEPEKFKSPYPLLMVLGHKAHFFMVTQEAFIPAGTMRYDGENQVFQDYDFDGVPELQFESGPNMNGNTWSSLARWNPETLKMEFAGTFCSFMEADTANQLWMESYSGSWYMAQHQKLYGWSHHKLTPIQMIVVSLREQSMVPNNCCIVSLYENPVFDLGIDSLQLVRDTFILEQDEGVYETNFFGPEGRR